MDRSGELSLAEVSSAATVWVEVQQEIDKAGQLALAEVLAKLKARVKHGQEPECVEDLDLETIKKMTITLQAGTLNTDIHPTLSQDILDLALDAFKKFINYVPALYLANPSRFESQLSEIFSEGMQNAPPEALIGYTSVLLRAVEHRLLRYLHDRFEERISVELKQPSPFRKEILKWCEKSKDEVDNKKALFPIMEALTARTIEIAMVENVANKAAKLYPDDELAKVVDTVCAMSKPFAINFLGLFEINSSGGFDHVRKNLIDINNRRIAGHLRANTDTLFSDIDDLRQYVKILLIAHDKLYEQLEATQINQNSMMCDKLLEVQKKNEAFQKLAGELSNQLEQALADNAKISNLTVTIDQLRKDLLGRDSEIRKLTIQLKDERQARQKAEAEVEYLQSKLVEQQKSHGAELKVVHDSFGAILQEERRKSEAALQEERCKFEAALQKERAQSKVALEQQRLHYQALLAQQSVQLGAVSLQEVVADEAGMITPKKAQSSLVATKSRFNYSTGGNETDETAFGPTAFGATFSPGGPVDDQ